MNSILTMANVFCVLVSLLACKSYASDYKYAIIVRNEISNNQETNEFMQLPSNVIQRILKEMDENHTILSNAISKVDVNKTTLTNYDANASIFDVRKIHTETEILEASFNEISWSTVNTLMQIPYLITVFKSNNNSPFIITIYYKATNGHNIYLYEREMEINGDNEVEVYNKNFYKDGNKPFLNISISLKLLLDENITSMSSGYNQRQGDGHDA